MKRKKSLILKNLSFSFTRKFQELNGIISYFLPYFSFLILPSSE